ncbi:class I SAM-dependent methyltransferase [Leptothermofonsia sichuanensis E412]|uniref:class I SAM-dependent methyltransferase n=1 Tax=Leptothermofonsia sichuanensis TaxID=2917832 RepID=UPI001CA655B6|nr:class I SAM-dependent methyltransferase [Leptothermofonsia sichuanensis]QZZ22113.1 class I SAM-dependent methyltransferase [Leptothermofonsia sichuanensis E412]
MIQQAETIKTTDKLTDKAPPCRFCGNPLHHTFVDLGMSPLCESFLSQEQLNQMEAFYPLHVRVCDHCFLVQLEAYVSPEHIFTEYAYFSSYADTWLKQCKAYTDQMVERFNLDETSQVVELASNDGYLLQYFVEKQIPCLGVEPATNIAKVAIARGVPTLNEFFGQECARKLVQQGKQADLVAANNVLAHVPDLNDFVAGIKILLKPQGVFTGEIQHLMRLMEANQFDTIYHEHFCYHTFTTLEKIFAAHGMTLFDVEELPTHGGSIRIYARHQDDVSKPISDRAIELKQREVQAGFTTLARYTNFDEQVRETKRKLLDFLIKVRREGKTIVGYGAPGKGNTLLNYCGIRTDFLDYTVDRNPYKHGKYLPGTHIPIYPPSKIHETKPDYVLILSWNFKDEIMEQMSGIREWGGQFVVPIPEVYVYS